MTLEKTIFQRIIDREIPARIEYEDDHCIAIHDLNPQAPFHVLVIPKKIIVRLEEAGGPDKDLLGHLLLVARSIAQDNDFSKGFRVVINNGPDSGESVPHLHVHLLSGRRMTWPPG